jgi:hypothetical protein
MQWAPARLQKHCLLLLAGKPVSSILAPPVLLTCSFCTAKSSCRKGLVSQIVLHTQVAIHIQAHLVTPAGSSTSCWQQPNNVWQSQQGYACPKQHCCQEVNHSPTITPSVAQPAGLQYPTVTMHLTNHANGCMHPACLHTWRLDLRLI